MKNGKVGKGPFIPPTDLEEHAWSLLQLPETQIGRCPLAIVSGRKAEWQPFYDVAQREFVRREAIWVEVPFFGQTPEFGKGELVAEFNERLRNDQRVQPTIRRVVEAWARD